MFLMHRYGLKPQVSELEVLAENNLIEFANYQGWIVTAWGKGYLENVTITNSDGLVMIETL